ncbi:hypothetical protein [Xanthobacter autotrophicus]|uniref:hypothetical protein n=1 Tax=Xanthobacter autotrophicus TaxID=280 RepID=UPI0024A6DE58|nr:hypothetical protein [Xanthobacter autotrophicus]MDI4658823.1 hypothetical protein [Xanthobacter autotrophicus]
MQVAQDRFKEWLRELARHMARTGRYGSWRLIQIELRFMQGIREAAHCFADSEIRTELDALCREAQKQAARAIVLPGLQTSTKSAFAAAR